MSIVETFQGCGAWDLPWRHTPPASVWSKLQDGSTILVFDKEVLPIEQYLSENLRQAALFEGYVEGIGSEGLDGYELSYLMGRPDGSGPSWPSRGALTGPVASSIDVDDLLRNGGTFNVNGITEGSFSAFAVDITDDDLVYPGVSPAYRFGLDELMSDWWLKQSGFPGEYRMAWKVRPGCLLDVERHVSGGPWEIHDVVLSEYDRRARGEGGYLNIPSRFRWRRTVGAVQSLISVYGEISENETTSVQSVDVADSAPITVPFNTPSNGTLGMILNANASGNGPELDSILSNYENNAEVQVEMEVETVGEFRTVISPGDRVLVAVPPEVLQVDRAGRVYEVSHFGDRSVINSYVRTVTWNVRPGYTVAVRSPAGVYTDISKYVVPGDDESVPDDRMTSTEFWSTPTSDAGGALRVGDDGAINSRYTSVYEHNTAL